LYQKFEPSLDPPVIGYLSRLCEENGLEILVDAFITLKDKTPFRNARLRLTGGRSGDDKRFIANQIRKLTGKDINMMWNGSAISAWTAYLHFSGTYGTLSSCIERRGIRAVPD